MNLHAGTIVDNSQSHILDLCAHDFVQHLSVSIRAAVYSRKISTTRTWHMYRKQAPPRYQIDLNTCAMGGGGGRGWGGKLPACAYWVRAPLVNFRWANSSSSKWLITPNQVIYESQMRFLKLCPKKIVLLISEKACHKTTIIRHEVFWICPKENA